MTEQAREKIIDFLTAQITQELLAVDALEKDKNAENYIKIHKEIIDGLDETVSILKSLQEV